jgi:hypothetical protein
MATSITSSRLGSRLKQKMFWHDPADATVATKISWQAIRGFESFLFSVLVASAHALVTVKIFAATDSSGTNATEVLSHAAPTVADAAGDAVYVECTIEQIKEVLAGATHVSVEVDMNNAAALAAVSYLFEGHRKHSGLTADQIA